jgi:hypothetical protein
MLAMRGSSFPLKSTFLCSPSSAAGVSESPLFPCKKAPTYPPKLVLQKLVKDFPLVATPFSGPLLSKLLPYLHKFNFNINPLLCNIHSGFHLPGYILTDTYT